MNKSIEEAAELLRNAYISGPVNPLRQFVEPTDADLAYKIQNTNTEQWLSEGRQIAGWKIGLTAKAVQKQLGVNQPDFGVLFSDMAVPTQSIFQMNKVIQPRAEAEIALILRDDIDHPDVTPEDIKKAIEYVVPAIEIVDSRITDWRISFADTVADNGSSAFYVLGEQRMSLNDLDLYTCGMVLEVNGEIASLGAGAACLGHPLNAAAWLAQTMINRGQPLKAGQVILTGALGPMVDLQAGQQICAKIGGLGQVSIEIQP
ncbi:MAG TPA: 2-keto-4-pentenoate hydratase [Gammaproteobacteria bacterium]|nr:2-keto-4-pentenoate hydratase [Gammaproteobacteria bacterium]|tara:strand:+ start:978 stop:1757 length:780 start_codon:yes stop_codon:yes gene_type:complete